MTRAEIDLCLSPQSRLLADSPEQDDYVYDGCGRLLVSAMSGTRLVMLTCSLLVQSQPIML